MWIFVFQFMTILFMASGQGTQKAKFLPIEFDCVLFTALLKAFCIRTNSGILF